MKKQKSNSKEALILCGRINSLYKNFKTFIDYNDLPQLKIKTISWQDRIKSLRRMTFSNVKMINNDTALLETVLENPIIMGDGLESHYYHEFTHIYDNVTLNCCEGVSIKYFTEFHAEQVELKKGTGFLTEKEEKKVLLSDDIKINIQFEGVSKPITIGDYMWCLTLEQKKLIPCWIEDYIATRVSNKDDALLELFRSFLNSSAYYLSTVHFLEKYCDEPINDLVDTQMYDEYLGEGLKEIYNLLKKESSEKEILLSLNKIEEKIKLDFILMTQKL